jgi:hypothetical protein
MAGNELNKGYVGIDRLKTNQGIISSRNAYLDSVQPQVSLSGLSASFVADFTLGTLPAQIQFLRASNALYTGSSGYLVGATNDQPRFQYNYLGNTLGLLIQGIIGNRAPNSNSFSSSPWGSSNLVTSPSTAYIGLTLAPDGSTGTVKIIPTASSARHNLSFFSGGNNQAYAPTTVHAFLKKAEYSIVRFSIGDTSTGSGLAFYVNLNNGTIYSNNSALKPNIYSTATVYWDANVQRYADDWFKVSITYATPYTKNTVWVAEPVPNETFSGWSIDSSNFLVMTGNGSSGFFAWGGSYEGTVPSENHIKTQGAAVAQTDESCRMTMGITGWFSQPGSFYVEYYGKNLNNFSAINNFISETPTVLATNQSGYGFVAMVIMPKGSGNIHGLYWYDGAISSNAGTTGLNKAVFTYSGFSSAGFTQSLLKYALNGDLVTDGIITNFNPSLVEHITIGHTTTSGGVYRINHLNNVIRKVLFYPTILTNDEMKEITKP